MDDVEVRQLFALPPDEFVAARDALAKQLRADGDGDRAVAVRKLRRPTVPAWAVNQLPREHADDVELLLAAGSRLREAQQEALAGRGGAGLREAAARRREVVGRLAELAARVLVDQGRDPAPHRAAITATLEAATVEPEAADALRSGTLSKELSPAADFGVLPAAMAVPAAEPAARERTADKEPEDRPARRSRLKGELADARERARLAVEETRAAERDARDARREAAAAAKELERLERQLRAVRERAETAERRREEARAASEQAAEHARQRAAEVEEAQQRHKRGRD